MWLKGFALPGTRMRGAVLLVALVCGMTSHAGAQAIHTVNTLIVVDANGVEMGTALDTIPTVVFQIEGRFAVVRVQTQRLTGGTIFFDAPDCTGNRYVALSRLPVEGGAVGPPGTTLYLADLTASSRPATIIKSDLQGGTHCFNQQQPVDTLLPAVAVIDLDTVFTPPFSVKAPVEPSTSPRLPPFFTWPPAK